MECVFGEPCWSGVSARVTNVALANDWSTALFSLRRSSALLCVLYSLLLLLFFSLHPFHTFSIQCIVQNASANDRASLFTRLSNPPAVRNPLKVKWGTALWPTDRVQLWPRPISSCYAIFYIQTIYNKAWMEWKNPFFYLISDMFEWLRPKPKCVYVCVCLNIAPEKVPDRLLYMFPFMSPPLSFHLFVRAPNIKNFFFSYLKLFCILSFETDGGMEIHWLGYNAITVTMMSYELRRNI